MNRDYKLEEIKIDYKNLVQFNEEFYQWLCSRIDDKICNGKKD